MEITFWAMFNQMTGLFALLLIGYSMNRLGLLPEHTEEVLSRLVTKLFLPALTIYTFMEECTVENLRTYGSWVVYGTMFVGASILLAILLAKLMARKNSYLEGIYRYVLAFPNTGGVGTPVVLALFGTAGLFQYQLFQLLNGIATYGWGIVQMIPNPPARKWTDHVKNICNPVFVSTAIGAVLGLTGAIRYLPPVVPSTLQTIGGAYSVLAMLLVGFVLGDYQVKDMVNGRPFYVVSLLRLLAIPCLYLAVLRLLHAPHMLCVMTCLVYACPCGMNTVVYPAAYGQDTRPGASMILISSALSMVTIPCIYMLL
ncbi:MAG: hypothetical protein HFI33_10265 [Lachnospiraceae bacterium]|nr:hypothetical protein [Lachnospiraceae bacterium]